MKHLFPAKAN